MVIQYQHFANKYFAKQKMWTSCIYGQKYGTTQRYEIQDLEGQQLRGLGGAAVPKLLTQSLSGYHIYQEDSTRAVWVYPWHFATRSLTSLSIAPFVKIFPTVTSNLCKSVSELLLDKAVGENLLATFSPPTPRPIPNLYCRYQIGDIFTPTPRPIPNLYWRYQFAETVQGTNKFNY